MVENKPAPSVRPPKRPVPAPMWKQALAFFLGLASVFLGYFLSETFGGPAALIGMGGYFLIGQFLLSRGNPTAFLESWSLVAAMNLTLLCIVLGLGPIELLLLVIVTLTSSCAGIALASMVVFAAQER